MASGGAPPPFLGASTPSVPSTAAAAAAQDRLVPHPNPYVYSRAQYLPPHQTLAPVPHHHHSHLLLQSYPHTAPPPLPAPHPLHANWKAVAAAAAPGSVVPSVQMTSAYRIGRYTPAERKVRLDRYREKRAQRNYNKRVKYDCRKMIADKRHRVQGRFVKREEEMAIAAEKARQASAQTVSIDSVKTASDEERKSESDSHQAGKQDSTTEKVGAFMTAHSAEAHVESFDKSLQVHSASSVSHSSSLRITADLGAHDVQQSSETIPRHSGSLPSLSYIPLSSDLQNLNRHDDRLGKVVLSESSLDELHPTAPLSSL